MAKQSRIKTNIGVDAVIGMAWADRCSFEQIRERTIQFHSHPIEFVVAMALCRRVLSALWLTRRQSAVATTLNFQF